MHPLRRILFLLLCVFTGLILLSLFLGNAPSATNALEVPGSMAATTTPLAVRMRTINLTAQDLLYDPTRDLLYASVPSWDSTLPNSLVSINVPTGTVDSAISIGTDPNRLAMAADGSTLYAGLDSNYAVRRVNLISQTAEIEFTLGSGFCGSFRAADMVVLENDPHAVVVSRRNSSCSPSHEGLAVYDDGVPRPGSTPGHSGSTSIEPSNNANILYGYNSESTKFGFRVMSVYTTGITTTSLTQGLISGFGVSIHYVNGLIYASSGAVINPETLSLVGSYAINTNYRSLVVPDITSGRTYFLNYSFIGDPSRLQVFDLATFAPIYETELPDMVGRPLRMVQIGPNLLAVNTDDDKIYFLEIIDLTESVFLPVTFYHYCPDFFDNFSNAASGWSVGDDSFVRREYLGGEYRVYTRQSGYFFLFRAPACEWDNYIVEVDARWQDEPGSGYGLLFGIVGSFQYYYLFDVNSDYQMYRLLRRSPEGFTEIVPPTVSGAIQSGMNTNHLVVTRNGAQIQLAVNGTTLGTWYDSVIAGKTDAGLVVSAYNNDPTADARFDNYRITRLNSETLNAPFTPLANMDTLCESTTANTCWDSSLELGNWQNR